jgi:hypothetical protein
MHFVAAATDARHGGPLMAVNMIKTGERYGYAFDLPLALMEHPGGLQQLHLDIMCEWEPWQRRALAALADPAGPQGAAINELRDGVLPLLDRLEKMGKVLSYAHGTLHAMNCQVRETCDQDVLFTWQLGC